jgi:flavin reductase (DIM6/NTAB) family NADH-FMN oxidoreductase RutF
LGFFKQMPHQPMPKKPAHRRPKSKPTVGRHAAPTIDPRAFRQLLGRFATGVTVVTTRGNKGKPVGVTINSFTSVSLQPPLVLFCLGNSAQCHDAFNAASFFAVNLLAVKQKKLSAHFASSGNKKWGDVPYSTGDHGCPILPGALGTVVCKKTRAIVAGDHTIFIGEVTELHQPGGKKLPAPLLYFASDYRLLKA